MTNKKNTGTEIARSLIDELVMLHDDLVDDVTDETRFEYFQKSINRTISFLEAYRDVQDEMAK